MGEAASVLGVSADTVRRWADEGRLESRRSPGGHRVVEGAGLARLATELAAGAAGALHDGSPATGSAQSARNRYAGIVTAVTRDTVMAQVEIRSGPHRVVSLMSREAADALGLEPGTRVIASVKATNVVVEVPARG
ncbi:MAG TPA: helix-turn-helix transcriptional regulator [Acidimicrobiales bacterium]|nr:helix-turn-helix transcriptional regulator [Acidimicrobiales bacterium]